MIFEALFITLVGMGGVFAFLLMLWGALDLLRRIVAVAAGNNDEEIAVAIAVAQSQE